MFKPIVPDNFNIPQQLITKEFLIRPLTICDVDQDYDAVISSLDHLKGVFGPNLDWPSPNLTKEEDLANLRLYCLRPIKHQMSWLCLYLSMGPRHSLPDNKRLDKK